MAAKERKKTKTRTGNLSVLLCALLRKNSQYLSAGSIMLLPAFFPAAIRPIQ